MAVKVSGAPTWHNEALPGDFAPTVLMPGDPKRSAYIAKNFLENARLVNDVRGVQGYTGLYKGKKVSVMASGMGTPAVAIYAHELYNVYGVENIIRIGTSGAVSPSVKMMDIVAAMSACHDSNLGAHYGYPYTLSPTASFDLLLKAHQNAQKLGINLKVGPVHCSDMLYGDEIDYMPVMRKMHILAEEMETAGLYLEAMRAGKNALCLLTVVDSIYENRHVSPEERENSLNQMITLALEMA